jgi:DNA primase large subunit
MIERERLAATQAEAGQIQVQRNNSISLTSTQFQRSVENALAKLRGASMKLEISSSERRPRNPPTRHSARCRKNSAPSLP